MHKEVKNRGWFILGITVFLFFILSSVSVSSYTSTVGKQETATLSNLNTNFFNTLLASWGTGNLDPTILKGILALIIVFIIFSALTSIQFPEQLSIRLILSIIIGFLSSIWIVPEEVYAAMSSYVSLGVAITFFVPLFILVAITFFSYKSGAGLGVLVSRMLWLVFGVYFLFLTLGVFALHLSGITFDKGDWDTTTPGIIDPTAQLDGKIGALKTDNFISALFTFTIRSLLSNTQIYRAQQTSLFMGFIMLIISLFSIFVAFSRSLQAYVRGMVKRSLLENYITDLELATESDKAKANIVKGKKNV